MMHLLVRRTHAANRSVPRLMCSLFAAVLFTLFAAAGTTQAHQLGAPFTDGAVLQRDMPVPVWGWADAGEKMTVTFAGQTKTTTANEKGEWMVELDPLTASYDAQELVVIGGADGHKHTVSDILVGEVWMASGQSNMQWKVGKSDARELLKQISERVAAGEEKEPVIREAQVTSVYSAAAPIRKATVVWSSDKSDFSAIGVAFAYELFRNLDVPIGILNCSFSQTKIQAWIPREGFAGTDDPYTQNLYQELLINDPTTPEHKAAWAAYEKSVQQTLDENARLVEQGKEAQPISTKVPGAFGGNRDSAWMYHGRLAPVVPYAIRGAIWNQGYASQHEGIKYYDNLHSLARGWRAVWDRPELPIYFHQFYTPGPSGNDEPPHMPSIGSTSDMRIGAWLARDIPNAGMASQIDIGGSIHYFNKSLPGKRLALHALKNQYPSAQLADGGKAKDLVVEGPMFDSYAVSGDTLTVTFSHADGGLMIGQANPKNFGIAEPVENGAEKIKLFYIAGPDRVWHQAKVKIDGNKVHLTAQGVDEPRGVSYATSGVSFQPNLYNQALLPASPFIYYDHELVTAETWPTEKLEIDGKVIDPSTVGLSYDFRKMPLLSTQFRDNAVLQAGQPVTIWGSAVHGWVHFGAQSPLEGTDTQRVVHFRFGDIEKTIPVTDGMEEWQVTLPAMPAGTMAYDLHVRFTVDGELIHERKAENIVFGDVWYVAAPQFFEEAQATDSGQIVRMITRKAKRSANSSPSPYSIAVSTTPGNRFASVWEDASGIAAVMGHQIAAKTGNPVGLIFMDNNEAPVELKSWIPAACLNMAPSLMEDYKQLASVRPGNEYYNANVHSYLEQWRTYFSEYVTEMMATGAVPDGAAWGQIPSLRGDVTTKAGQTYNVLTESFTPAAVKGIVFITSPSMFDQSDNAKFGEQMTALANCWISRFDAKDPVFIYTVPSPSLASVEAGDKPSGIKGESKEIVKEAWFTQESAKALVEQIVEKAYP